MSPLKVDLSGSEDGRLTRGQARYALESLLTIAGYPWHIMRDDYAGPVDLSYAPRRGRDCRLFIRSDCRTADPVRMTPEAIEQEGVVFLEFDRSKTNARRIDRDGEAVRVDNDLLRATFHFLTGQQEVGVGRDRRDRHRLDDLWLYRNRLLHVPIVNQYARLIRETFASRIPPIPCWPGNARMAVALSHDVDYPEMIRWIELLRYCGTRRQRSRWSEIRDIINGSNHFWRFHDWMEQESQLGLRSAFYFCGLKGSLPRYLLRAPDPFYDVRTPRFREVIRVLVDRGFEVGLHSSYEAYRSQDQFASEKKVLEEVAGRPVPGNRHHYWHIDPDNPAGTAQLHDRLGFLYDSSLALSRRAGFRYGVCSPFHLYDRDTSRVATSVQLPPTLMDAHLFHASRWSYLGGWREEIDTLWQAVRDHQGVFVPDYHVRVMNTTLFPEWAASCRFIWDHVTESGDCYCDTPANVVRHWLAREDRIRDASCDETRGPDQSR